MKIIEPSKISGEIGDLIDTAKKNLIIISPYNELTGWNKMINKINKALLRGVNVVWYSRKDVKEKYPEEIWRILSIRPILIENLHAKIYMNEKDAVVSSMNFSKTSDDNSTDIGIKTTSTDEYNDVFSFYEVYVRSAGAIDVPDKQPLTSTQNNINSKDKPGYNMIKYYPANEIHRYISGKYGKFENEYNNKFEFLDDEIRLLKYQNFIKSGHLAKFEFTEQEINIKISLPNSSRKQFDKSYLTKKGKKLVFNHTLALNSFDNSILYSYRSNFVIGAWDNQKLSYFLEDLDNLVELIFSN